MMTAEAAIKKFVMDYIDLIGSANRYGYGATFSDSQE